MLRASQTLFAREDEVVSFAGRPSRNSRRLAAAARRNDPSGAAWRSMCGTVQFPVFTRVTSMNQKAIALAAGFATNVVGYIVSIVVLNLFGRADTPSFLWVLAPILWLGSLILGGWVASVIARSRQFLLGYLSAVFGMFAVVLMMQLGLGIAVPPLATALGVLIVSGLGTLGALTYSRK
jgi:hypothetical protein